MSEKCRPSAPCERCQVEMGSDPDTDEDFLEQLLYEVSWSNVRPESATALILERFKR